MVTDIKDIFVIKYYITTLPIIPPFLRGVRGDRRGSPLSEITLIPISKKLAILNNKYSNQ